MKNPFGIFKSGPEQCSLAEDVKDILRSRAWWEERLGEFHRIQADSGDGRGAAVSSMGTLRCFGDDENSQTPAPSLEDYQTAVSRWEVLLLEFQTQHPAFYVVWSLGQKDLGLALDGLKVFAAGGGIEPSYYVERMGYSTLQEDERYLPLAALGQLPTSSLFGPYFRAARTVDRSSGYMESFLHVQNAQSGLNFFQGTVSAYEENPDRGREILEDYSAAFNSALEDISTAYSQLKTYLEEAQEKYEAWQSQRESEHDESEVQRAKASAAGRLWGEGEV